MSAPCLIPTPNADPSPPGDRAAALELALREAEATMREFADALLFGGGRRDRRLGDELMRRAGFAREALEAAKKLDSAGMQDTRHAIT
jgi:hypothetical protein